MMARRQKPRRGIVLLVILTLLTLLIVVGITFTLISGHYRRAAEAGARKNRYGDPPDRLLDRAMYQLVRDTNDVHSVVRSHSLLRDKYGESIRGRQVGNSVLSAGGQFLEFEAAFDDMPNLASVGNAMRTRGFLNGCVLTFVTGNSRNFSSRVVQYEMNVTDPPRATFRVLLPKLEASVVASSVNGDQFVVNGHPFVGTGAGYDDATRELDRQVSIGPWSVPQALLPNRVGEPTADTAIEYLQGGLNESYDAADYQNLFLAARALDPANPTRWQVLPSFHRIALINYWARHSSGLWDNPDPILRYDFRRRVVLRPMPWDHEHFDGGNAFLAEAVRQAQLSGDDQPITDWLINGPWDVDNDGDGEPDSIWLDLGLPIQTDPSGRRFKPLFAILCEDLDGKLNLNAHGNLSHLVGLPTSPQPQPLGVVLPTAGGTIPSQSLPRAHGYGPPEISLVPLLGSVMEYQQLLQGVVHPMIGPLPGRYGFNALPGDNLIPALSLLKMIDYPFPLPAATDTNYFLPNTPLSSFSNPYDLRGELAFGLDYRGMPLYERPSQQNVLINTAYELDLSTESSRGLTQAPVDDMPFSMAELERLLRHDDVDAFSLPDRLLHLVDTFRNDSIARRGVTTDSYDSPTPSILPWRELLNEFATVGMDRPRTVRDIVKAKMMYARRLTMVDLNNPAVVDRLNIDLDALVCPEMTRGLRLDLNRPFGNGRDDSGNRVVDEHGVGPGLFRGEEALDETIWDAIFGPVPFDHDNDGVHGSTDTTAFLARHHFAKHLYVLMMAIKPAGLNIDFDGDPTNDNPVETAYGIAQWAINVVDFRDADSIMTPFEFAINPFLNRTNSVTGWEVDGNLLTDENPPGDPFAVRGVVWGCERPELLITEAIALHDRRTEDLATPGGRVTDDPPDPHFDQRLRPRGSFFVELYNPWAGDDRTPAEFYGDQAPPGNWPLGVQLSRFAPAGPFTPAGSPVWRMIVAKGTDRDRDPDHWNPTERLPQAAIERSIYFTPFAGPVEGTEAPFYTDLPVAPILPGRYAVVGSAGQIVDHDGNRLDLNNNGAYDYVTTIGRRRDAFEDGAGGLLYGQTRRIVLEPDLNLNLHQAQVLGNIDAAFPEPFPPDIQPAVGVVINQPRSLNVTEPVLGYPDYTVAAPGPNGEIWDSTAADYEGAYTPPLNEPLDAGISALENDRTVDDYCVVHLQRLANPVLPYHPVLNPYRTIDSMSSDLVSFNGVSTDYDENAGDDEPRLTTRERGRSLDPGNERRWLWKHERGPLEGGPPAPDSEDETASIHILDQALGHTLGYLNEPYRPFFHQLGAPNNPPSSFAPPTPPVFPGFPNNRPADFYVGGPAVVTFNTPPFPWLTWNNRPFVTPHELMLVPTSRSSRLAFDFELSPPPGSSYAPGVRSRFGHLLNFFQATADNGVDFGSNFYRLFELAHVPSRFVNTELYLNPGVFTGAGGHPPTERLHPPFNRISRYRDPGKVNLNTLFLPRTWSGVRAGYEAIDWANLVSTRRGYGPAASENTFLPDNDVPTFFANPFRAPGSARLVPPTAVPNQLNRLDIESTLLRSDSVGYTPNPGTPLLEKTSPDWYNHTDLNPYFRYQELSRLGNLVTTRSHVFAVWITMGFFEVEPIPPAANPAELEAQLRVHPDGYQLGRELGEHSGTVKRHRAFYIIDRSIPVAYEPGENHNVDHAVRLRRFIE